MRGRLFAIVLAVVWGLIGASQLAHAAVDARTEIAAALYGASTTQAAKDKSADTRIRALDKQIIDLRGEVRAGNAKASELAAKQEQLIALLAEKDRNYAEAIAVFRNAVVDIAKTPEGAAALAKFNAGDQVGALIILDRLRGANNEARKSKQNIESAADGRRIAYLALEAREHGKVTTASVIVRFEEVTRLDSRVFRDWMTLSRLYRDAARDADEKQAINEALKVSHTDTERFEATSAHLTFSLRHLLRHLTNSDVQSGDLLKDQNDLAEIEKKLRADGLNGVGVRDLGGGLRSYDCKGRGATLSEQAELLAACGDYRGSLAIRRLLAAANPGDADTWHDVAVSLEQLGDKLLRADELSAARKNYEESLAIRRRLAAVDASNLKKEQEILSLLQKLGDLQMKDGDHSGALKRYQESLAILRRQASIDPSNAVFQDRLRRFLWKLATIPGAGVHWADVAATFEQQERDGRLVPSDRWMLEQAHKNAAKESAQ